MKARNKTSNIEQILIAFHTVGQINKQASSTVFCNKYLAGSEELENFYPEDVPTKEQHINGKKYEMEIICTAGAEKYTAMTDQYSINSHFTVLFFQPGKGSMEDLKARIERESVIRDGKPHLIPVVIYDPEKTFVKDGDPLPNTTKFIFCQKPTLPQIKHCVLTASKKFLDNNFAPVTVCYDDPKAELVNTRTNCFQLLLAKNRRNSVFAAVPKDVVKLISAMAGSGCYQGALFDACRNALTKKQPILALTNELILRQTAEMEQTNKCQTAEMEQTNKSKDNHKCIVM